MLNLIQRKVRSFGSDRRGNVVAMFALSLLPLMGFVGAAVDYSRAAMVRSRIQSAIDATALKLSRDGAKLSDSDLSTMANRYFGAVLDISDIPSKPTLKIQRTEDRVVLSASTSVPTVFMQTLGVKDVPVGTSATGAFDLTKIELVLVLDNTGSMASSNKMTELKKAALGMIDQIEAMKPTGDQIQVSIVPFDTQVNVGSQFQWKEGNAYKHAPWLGFNDAGSHFSDAANAQAAWSGCVMDRYQSYDVDGTAPTQTTRDTLYPAQNCKSLDWQRKPLLGQIKPLTNDWTSLRSTISAMSPSGNTNVTIGFHWGLQMLSNGTTPMSLGKPFNTPNLRKFMVLLTDGDNTQNRWSGSQYQIDQRTRLMCDQINDRNLSANSPLRKNIEVFTVRVMDGNANLLKSCASDPSQYYEVKTASQISAVFKSIFDKITAIRLIS